MRQLTPLPRMEVSDPARLTDKEIAALVDECGLRTSRMTARMYGYTFDEADYEYERDKSGRATREHSKLFQVAPVVSGNRNRWVHVQVAEDGAPFSEEKIARERERAARQIADDEQEAARGQARPFQPSPPGPYVPHYSSYGIRVEKRAAMSRAFWYVNATDFLLWYEFYSPRRATYKGRDAILLNFRPRPGYVFDQTNVRFKEGLEDFGRTMSQLGGRLWIDARDHVIVRIEAAPAAEVQSAGDAPDDKAPLGFEYARLDDSTWAPLVSWYDSYGRENLFWKTPTSRALKYSPQAATRSSTRRRSREK